MRRIAVISTDNNPDYFFYVPIVTWLWNKLGWEVALFHTRDSVPQAIFGMAHHPDFVNKTFEIPGIDGVRSGTCAQTVRHFVADVFPHDAYWMVQDIDLLPLKDFWHPD